MFKFKASELLEENNLESSPIFWVYTKINFFLSGIHLLYILSGTSIIWMLLQWNSHQPVKTKPQWDEALIYLMLRFGKGNCQNYCIPFPSVLIFIVTFFGCLWMSLLCFGKRGSTLCNQTKNFLTEYDELLTLS